jgi:hypothetical protein
MLDFGSEFDLTLGVGSSNSEAPKTHTPKLKNKLKVFKNTEEMIAEIAETVPKAFVVIPSSKKRPSSFDLQKSPTTTKTPNVHSKKAKAEETDTEATRLVLEAQNCLVQAAALYGEQPKKQTRILNLIAIFRSFTDDGELPSTAGVLSAHTTALEKVIRRVEKATTAQLSQNPQPQNSQRASQNHPGGDPTTSQNSLPPTSGQQGIPSFADMLRKDTLKPTEHSKSLNSDWTTIGHKGKPTPTISKPIRLVLEIPDKDRVIKPILLRDGINNRVKLQGFKGVFALSTTKSGKGNLVVYLYSKAARDFFYKDENDLRTTFRHTRILEDDSCHKVVVHGVSTEDFNIEGGLSLIRKELEMFNNGLRLTTDPIWLSPDAKRRERQGASILITFQTEAEAKKAIQYRLFVGGASLRAELVKDKSKANSQGSLC